MRILFNMVSPNRGGGFQTYNNNLLKGLLANDNNYYLIFLNEESINSFSIPDQDNIQIISVSRLFSKTIPRYIWMQFVLPIHLMINKIDILFSPMNVMPILVKILKIKSILVVHTNLLWMYPEVLSQLSKINIFSQKLLRNLSVLVANKIIVDSETAKKELLSFFPNIIDKTHTIHLGVDHDRFTKNKKNVKSLDNIDIINENYFLTISSAVRYHCLIELITAYDNLNSKHNKIPKFVLISSNIHDPIYYNEIQDFIKSTPSSKKIILIENIDSSCLPGLYKNAELYIFSSYCEVFGLTNLEAMVCGTPVLTSNKSALPEICGNAAVYFDPFNSKDIENKMSYVYFDNKIKNKLILKGFKHVKKFSWEKTFSKTKSILYDI